VAALHLGHHALEIAVVLLRPQVAALVVEARLQPFPHVGVEAFADVLGHLGAHVLAEGLGADVPPGVADHGQLVGQQAVAGQVVQRRDQLALGEIPGGPEDHDGAGSALTSWCTVGPPRFRVHAL
jgi:hypothetical protein